MFDGGPMPPEAIQRVRVGGGLNAIRLGALIPPPLLGEGQEERCPGVKPPIIVRGFPS